MPSPCNPIVGARPYQQQPRRHHGIGSGQANRKRSELSEVESQTHQLRLVVDPGRGVAYYGFILLVAFDKPLLSQKIGNGVMTLGMPIGVAVIVFTIIHHLGLHPAREQRVRLI